MTWRRRGASRRLRELFGCGDGPPVDARTLAKLGVESAPRFRAYIAAQSVA